MIEEISPAALSLVIEAEACSNQKLEEDLAGYLPQISNMSEQLRQTSAQIERSVVEVCTSFEGIAERARTTVARSTGFLGRRAEESSGKPSFEALVENCGATLVNITDSIAESARIASRAIESIEQIDQVSQEINVSLRLMEDFARQNKMLALNARIEAAHAGERGAGFAVVAVEVASQAQKSREVSASVGGLVENLRSLAQATLADLQTLLQRDAVRVEECRREANESLRDLRTAHEEMKGMLSGMNEDSALLARDIGAAVRGMQFQDRVSQRIAHVVEGLDALHLNLAARSGPVQAEVGPVYAEAAELNTYTLHEERQVAGVQLSESPGGDVELF